MKCSALLVLLVVMGTHDVAVTHPVCPAGCVAVQRPHHHVGFKHVPSDINTKSVAPWTLQVDSVEDREPESIQYAKCEPCTIDNMVSEPIFIQVHVFRKVYSNSTEVQCRCNYKLSVGCTCTQKQ